MLAITVQRCLQIHRSTHESPHTGSRIGLHPDRGPGDRSSYGTLAGLGGHGSGSTLATPLFVFAASDLASIATGSTLIVDPRHDAAAFSPGAAPRPAPG